MISGLCNLEYYKSAFLEIQKFMEVREEGMELQEETVQFVMNFWVICCKVQKIAVLHFVSCTPTLL